MHYTLPASLGGFITITELDDARPFFDELFRRKFGADIFFDDSPANVESARQHVATGHVPRGRRGTKE